jgi:hypothetical protein
VKTALAILLLLTLTGAACSPKQTAKPPARASAEKPYDFEKEGTIPPPAKPMPKPEADVEEIPIPQSEIVGEEIVAPKDTTKAGKAGGEAAKKVEGKEGGFAFPVYRVQVLATSSERSAVETKNKIENRLGLPAYIAFEDGMYKVRVGDSPTRETAEKVRTKVRGAGYTDAWIVMDTLRGKPEPGTNED